ncbi:MAG: glycosyltransferase family 39 protein [Proteobacteria bacterium]|nr:glycosyltransferase family 39 protein [Pseudomonadota bacterium]
MIGWGAGVLATQRLAREPWSPTSLWLSVGVAFGGVSLIVYAWLAAGKPGLVALIALEALAVAAAFAAGRPAATRSRSQPRSRPPALLVALLVCAAAACAAGMVRTFWALPHGTWDAVEIWNLRAVAFTRAGLAEAFSEVRHADYPLLVPLAVAHLWAYTGESIAVPIAISSVFTVATAGLLYTATCRSSGALPAAAVTIALLAAPHFAYGGGSQRADIPLSFFGLGTAVALAGYARERASGLLVLAGVQIGCAAWTKNEGLLFAAVVTAAWLATDGRRELRRLGLLAAGAAPFALALLHHKLTCGGVTDLVAAQGADTWQRLGDPGRYALIARAFAREGGYYAAAALALGVGLRRRERGGERRNDPARFIPWTLAGMLLGYAGTYLLTPHDLGWHLWSSLERLLVQLWPMTLFYVGLRAR